VATQRFVARKEIKNLLGLGIRDWGAGQIKGKGGKGILFAPKKVAGKEALASLPASWLKRRNRGRVRAWLSAATGQSWVRRKEKQDDYKIGETLRGNLYS